MLRSLVGSEMCIRDRNWFRNIRLGLGQFGPSLDRMGSEPGQVCCMASLLHCEEMEAISRCAPRLLAGHYNLSLRLRTLDPDNGTCPNSACFPLGRLCLKSWMTCMSGESDRPWTSVLFNHPIRLAVAGPYSPEEKWCGDAWGTGSPDKGDLSIFV